MKKKILLAIFTAILMVTCIVYVYADTDHQISDLSNPNGAAVGDLAVGPGGIQAWTSGYATVGLSISSYNTSCSGWQAPNGFLKGPYGMASNYYILGNDSGQTFTLGYGGHEVKFSNGTSASVGTSAFAY